jgi:hypothetical protein
MLRSKESFLSKSKRFLLLLERKDAFVILNEFDCIEQTDLLQDFL